MYTLDSRPKGYFVSLQRLLLPGARLVLVHSNDPAKNGYFILPGGWRVAKRIAEALISGPHMQPHDHGLFPDQPQSWRLCSG
jgi:hypothetical protein